MGRRNLCPVRKAIMREPVDNPKEVWHLENEEGRALCGSVARNRVTITETVVSCEKCKAILAARSPDKRLIMSQFLVPGNCGDCVNCGVKHMTRKFSFQFGEQRVVVPLCSHCLKKMSEDLKKQIGEVK